MAVIKGYSYEVLPKLDKRQLADLIFDLVFIDHWKEDYLEDLQRLEELRLLLFICFSLRPPHLFCGGPLRALGAAIRYPLLRAQSAYRPLGVCCFATLRPRRANPGSKL